MLPAITNNPSQTMNSREIAELTGKEHKNVMSDIRKMMDDISFASAEFLADLPDGYGRSQPVFILDKELTMTLVAGYSAALRYKIVKRWAELECAKAFNVPTTLSGALRLAAEQAETIEQQALQIAAAAPAVEFVGRYVDSTGSKGFRQVCKVLKVKEPEFRAFLYEKKIMYKLAGEWMPYAEHTDAGRFEVKAGTAKNEHAFNSARFTPKGIAWVAGEYAKYQLEN